jgi:hypothetical protein
MSKDLAYTIDKTGVLEVPFSIQGEATGGQILLQKVMTIILTDPDDPYRDTGGGLYASLRNANLNDKSLTRVKNLINISITNTVEIIQTEQSDLSDLPDTERLSSIELTEVTSPGDNTLYASFTVISASGEALIAALNLEI